MKKMTILSLLVTLSLYADKDFSVIRGSGWETSFTKNDSGFLFGRKTADEKAILAVKILFLDATGNPGVVSGISEEAAADGHTQVKLAYSFPAGKEEVPISLSADGTITVSADVNISTIRIEGDLKYGFLPGFFLEDIIYARDQDNADQVFHVPPENAVGAFLGHGNGIFLASWPEGKQNVRILSEQAKTAKALAIEVQTDGKEFYAGIVVADNIWHDATLTDSQRGNDHEIPWTKPFSAKWRTQLSWVDIETAFLFAEKKQTRWRGGIYPVWFDSDSNKPMIHLRGGFYPSSMLTIIYPFDDNLESLMGFLNRTPMAQYFTELIKKNAPNRPAESVPSVGFTACWGTGLLRSQLIPAGIQDREQQFLHQWLESVLNSNKGTQRRREQYGMLTDKLVAMINDWSAETKSPEAAQYIQEMESIAAFMKAEYANMISKDGRNSPAEYVAYTEKLAERMRQIMTVAGTELSPEYDDIVQQLNSVTWAQQETTGGSQGGGYGHLWRDWAYKAGSKAVTCPESARYAAKLRKEIREHLRARSWETSGI